MSARVGAEAVALRARDIADLAVASGYPCISVILPTRPAPCMTPEDRSRLADLVGDVEEELSRRSVMNRSMLLEKLAEQVDRAVEQPTNRALCIYVSRAIGRSFRLPQPVTALAVVESDGSTGCSVTTASITRALSCWSDRRDCWTSTARSVATWSGSPPGWTTATAPPHSTWPWSGSRPSRRTCGLGVTTPSPSWGRWRRSDLLALVTDGDLAAHDRVALVLRR